jgi:hypothetical protein
MKACARHPPSRQGQRRGEPSSSAGKPLSWFAMRATIAQAQAQNGEDPDGGLHLQSSPDQGIGPSSQLEGGPDRDHHGQISRRFTSAHR